MIETWFIAAHAVAFVGWAALFALPWIGRRRAVLAARWAAVPLCLLYLLFLPTHLKAIPTDAGYTLAAVARAFDKPVLLLAGWIHYLVLDLFGGSWQAEHSERAGVPYALLLPCLFATMMIGPLGLLLTRLDLGQVQPPGLALVMAGELLKPAPGMLVLSGDRGGSALLGLLVEETHVVHAPHKAATRARFRYLSDEAGRFA